MDESVKMDLEDLARQNRICYFPVFAGLLSAAPGLAEKLPYCSNVSLYKDSFITLYRLLADHAFSRCIVTYCTTQFEGVGVFPGFIKEESRIFLLLRTKIPYYVASICAENRAVRRREKQLGRYRNHITLAFSSTSR